MNKLVPNGGSCNTPLFFDYMGSFVTIGAVLCMKCSKPKERDDNNNNNKDLLGNLPSKYTICKDVFYESGEVWSYLCFALYHKYMSWMGTPSQRGKGTG